MTTLETPVPLLQHEDEFAQLLTLYRHLQPKRILEVGTYHGGSLYHWLRNAPAGATVVSIDSYATGIDNSHLYREWTPDNVELVIIRGHSQRPSIIERAAAHGPYDWIYIDADHHEPAVRADWNAYSPLAKPGGLVVLHDISPSTDPSIQVAPLWAELREQHHTSEITSSNGMGIGVVHMSSVAKT